MTKGLIRRVSTLSILIEGTPYHFLGRLSCAQREEEALELDAFGKMLETYEEDTVFRRTVSRR